MKGIHAEHIQANCDCQFAVSFDGKTDVEGYDPQKYLDMYNNAAPGKNSRTKINALRSSILGKKYLLNNVG